MKSELTIDQYGTKVWKLPNGIWHREDGPAVVYPNGFKCWYINGLRHRENGPSIENGNGIKRWYINGVSYTEQEYKQEMMSKKLKLLLK
jgi:hypothetical protein